MSSAPLDPFMQHKTIPSSIRQAALFALSHYPKLRDVEIEFAFRPLKNVTMQARPQADFMLRSPTNRRYGIYLNSNAEPEKGIRIKELPNDVLIGWIGHELGHIMDYTTMSNYGMTMFGIRYVSSRSFLRAAELRADSYAVNHGLGDYLIATKSFLLNNPHSTERYKSKILKYYPSSDIIRELMQAEI